MDEGGSIERVLTNVSRRHCWCPPAGGSIILSTGIIGIFVFLVSMVLLCVAHRRSLGHYRMGALAGLYTSTGLLILGIVLYAYKLNAGYSFILMTVSGFFYFVGTGLVIGGGWSFRDADLQKEQVPDSH
jgi:high-affinity Fe2+/Pb2+ permease